MLRLEAALAAAEAASRTKWDSLASMSREIGTPLDGAPRMADLLADSAPARASALSAAIRQSGGVLLALVNDILDLARIAAGKLSLELRPVDLGALLHRGAGRADVRCLRAGRCRHRVLLRRLRHGPGDRPPAGAVDGRRNRRLQPAAWQRRGGDAAAAAAAGGGAACSRGARGRGGRPRRCRPHCRPAAACGQGPRAQPPPPRTDAGAVGPCGRLGRELRRCRCDGGRAALRPGADGDVRAGTGRHCWAAADPRGCAVAERPAQRVAAATANVVRSRIGDCLAQGFVEVLPKPARPDELRATLHRLPVEAPRG